MTFHLIPAIWRDDWGLEITESFLVTPGGAEPFCTFPRKLFVKPQRWHGGRGDSRGRSE